MGRPLLRWRRETDDAPYRISCSLHRGDTHHRYAVADKRFDKNTRLTRRKRRNRYRSFDLHAQRQQQLRAHPQRDKQLSLEQRNIHDAFTVGELKQQIIRIDALTVGKLEQQIIRIDAFEQRLRFIEPKLHSLAQLFG